MDTMSEPPDAEQKSSGAIPPRANRPRKWWVKLLRKRQTWIFFAQMAFVIIKIAKFIYDLIR
jgi:hypothetical protein